MQFSVVQKTAADSVVVITVWNSEFVTKLHDSDGCTLSKDEGSNYDGYDSPDC